METFGAAPAAVPAPAQTVAQTPDALRQTIAQQQAHIHDQADSERAAKAFVKRELAGLDESIAALTAKKWQTALSWAAGGTVLGLIAAAIFKRKG